MFGNLCRPRIETGSRTTFINVSTGGLHLLSDTTNSPGKLRVCHMEDGRPTTVHTHNHNRWSAEPLLEAAGRLSLHLPTDSQPPV